MTEVRTQLFKALGRVYGKFDHYNEFAAKFFTNEECEIFGAIGISTYNKNGCKTLGEFIPDIIKYLGI